VGTLSGGQKQRLALATALLNRPRVLFLDEPTTGLDPQARRRVWELVHAFKQEGGSVLLTTHYMDEAEHLCDDLAIVDHGKVIARGSPRAVIDSLGAESVVEFSLAEGTPPLDEGELRGLAGVSAVRREAEHLVLSVTRTQDAIAALFALCARHDAPLEDLRTHRPTLEDVFVSLTGKHLRDE
jgi:ABC-2 type transport system ATP-binding protein